MLIAIRRQRQMFLSDRLVLFLINRVLFAGMHGQHLAVPLVPPRSEKAYSAT